MTVDDPLHSRFLVIGSGIAGLQFALLAAAHGTVRIATKKESRESNTNYAQGGIAAVLSPLDDFASHVRDTLTAGDGLCREPVVRAMVEAAPRLIARLLGVGCDFSRQGDAADAPFALGREGGHSHSRIVHAKDLTGREIEARLLAACQRHPDIRLDENHLGLDLIRGRALGLDGGGGGAHRRLLDPRSPDADPSRLPRRRGRARHRRLRQGLLLHVQPRHRHRRRAGHGVPRRRDAGRISSSCSSIPPACTIPTPRAS